MRFCTSRLALSLLIILPVGLMFRYSILSSPKLTKKREEGGKEGEKERTKEGKREGRKEGKKEGRKEGRKEGKKDMKGKFKKQKIWLSYILPPLVLEMTHVGKMPFSTLTSKDASMCGTEPSPISWFPWGPFSVA